MYIFADFSHFKDYCVTITNNGDMDDIPKS